MKKIGQFFFAFIPFLLIVAIQLVVTAFSVGVSALIEYTWYASSKTASFGEIFDDLNQLWTSQNFNTHIMILYALATIALFGLWYYARYGGSYLPIARSTYHPLSLLGIVMLMVGMQYLSTYIVNFTANLFPHWLNVYEDLLETAGLNEHISIAMLVYSVLLAPFCEELAFRGITMRQAQKCLPFWAANLMQAALFGAFHMNMIQGVYAFFLGLILGYVAQKSNSIHSAIVLHLLFNFWGTVLSAFFYIENTVFSFLFWFFFGIAMTVGGLLIFQTGVRRAEQCALPDNG
ncbi:MAG: type II CAAX prenyl endopeptidase Rce1 family protein [Roseburia sp.]